jgi:EAL domain-containing protein (putative c-di-GMP-specific phosphodiesterase class I)
VTASFGLRCVPAAEASTEDLLRDADSAMYRAKAMGKARCEAFDQTMHEQALERLDLEGGLRDAIENSELFLVYQPQVSLPAGRIVSVEALVRWEHPRRGTLLPNSFIPLAEQSGLIGLLGGWTLREACRQGAEWARTGHPLRVSVNVSPRQLAAPGFVAEVAAALHAAGHEPSLLCLEITESAVLSEPERVAETLERLKALGVRLALDDFGVGYSSLAQLRSLLPVDELKIDRSFVSGMTVGHEDRAIVDAVVRLATLLGMEAVAEGVETSEQAGALLEVDCGVAQGFHFARPVRATEVTRLLAHGAVGEFAI